jgi:hypothetical protein
MSFVCLDITGDRSADCLYASLLWQDFEWPVIRSLTIAAAFR